MIPPSNFKRIFDVWLCVISDEKQIQIAMDGKYFGKGDANLGMVHAYDVNGHTLLGVEDTPGKGHELEGLKSLVALIGKKKALISIDALGCQKELIQKIIDQQSDYLIQVKNNQKTLRKDVQFHMESLVDKGLASHASSIEKNKGRVETRTCYVSSETEWINQHHQEFAIKTIIQIQRKIEKNNTINTEISYYISSKIEDAAYFNTAVRNHWHIENNLHWTLDVLFKEDDCKIKDSNQLKNLAIMRRAALHLIKKQQMQELKKISLKNLRFKNSLNCDYLDNLFLTP